MSWLVPSLLLILTLSISEEAKQFAEQAGKQADEEAFLFLKSLYEQEPAKNSPKCKNCPSVSENFQPSRYNLLVFMSFSVPLESWKEWSQSLEKAGGILVLRGLPGNSFLAFSQKIKELRDAGVTAPICIDPEAYGRYGVQEVPTTVLLNGEKYNKIAGNIYLETVLKIFKEKGPTETE